MNKRNYQKELEQKIFYLSSQAEVPTLLLHSCCAPCSSYVLEYLSQYFQITVFYYNPNIYPPEEYEDRAKEQQRFIREFPMKHPVSFLEGGYDTERFYETVKGMEHLPEAARAVRRAMSCGFQKRRRAQSVWGFRILRQRCPSVR